MVELNGGKQGPTAEDSINYMKRLFSESFKLANRNTNCEANIFFHVPNKKTVQIYTQKLVTGSGTMP